MTALTKVKLALTLIGLTLFFYGVRVDDSRLRMIAIGFVAVASLLRFVRGKTQRDSPQSQSPQPPSE
jgi:hypothetical protein